MIKALLDVVESGNKNIELMVVTEKETRFLSEEELDKLIEAAKEWLSMKGGNEKWFSDDFCGLIIESFCILQFVNYIWVREKLLIQVNKYQSFIEQKTSDIKPLTISHFGLFYFHLLLLVFLFLSLLALSLSLSPLLLLICAFNIFISSFFFTSSFFIFLIILFFS